MAKGKSSSSAVPEAKPRKPKKSKKKKFWVNNTGVTKKKSGVEVPLPPKGALEYSTNWKKLQQLMNEKTAAQNSTPETQKVLEKKSKLRVDLAAEETPSRKVKPKSATEEKRHAANGALREPVKENGTQATKPVAKGKRQKGRQPPEENHIKDKKRKRESEKRTGSAAPVLATPDIWFDDVDPDEIEAAMGQQAGLVARQQVGYAPKAAVHPVQETLVKDGGFTGLTKAVAMDCEMVGVGPDGVESILARVSIVNHFGKCVYDKYVKPTEKVTDYRTPVSGIRPHDVKNGEEFKVVQKEVADLLSERMLVGHAIHNDLKILFLDHPKRKIRDTQKYKPFRKIVNSGRPSLKLLCRDILNIRVQESEHCSVQDAQAAMRLYTLVKKQWEAELKEKRAVKRNPTTESVVQNS
uniref:RNA exonuclease 4 n=1 Tax=Callorhinchus milii TaxID=7868 RepID=V9KME7_CALMI